jgi:sugar lactone lactonase YvrE
MKWTRNLNGWAVAGFAAAGVLVSSGVGAQNAGDIALGIDFHPESIAALPGGGLLIGSIENSEVWRVAPGATEAELWIAEGLGLVLGVFAHDGTAYVCSSDTAEGTSHLLSFDLDTAAPTGSFAFPSPTGICNDIAVSADGTVFVTDLTVSGGNGRVLALVTDDEGVSSMQVVISGRGIGGVDGLAFLGGSLYVNDVRTDKLYRLDLDGTNLTGWTEMNLSQPLQRPDGMRTTEDGMGMLVAGTDRGDEDAGLAENGKLYYVTVDGDNATVELVADGFGRLAGTAQIGDTAYVILPKFGERGEDVDAGMFWAHAVQLNM